MEMIEGPLSILIVEDNAPMAANIYDYLEACGHKPDAAPDGKSGLGMVQANHYDAITLQTQCECFRRRHGVAGTSWCAGQNQARKERVVHAELTVGCKINRVVVALILE